MLKSTTPEPEFVCLECGSKKCRSEINRNPVRMDEADPWSCVTSIVECWDCGVRMPRRLARRWNMSLEEARAVWVEKFRNDKRSRVPGIS
jgi:hypothetical protein